MQVRNLTAKTDEEFLQESITACAAAVAAGNEPLARYWAEHAVSFARSAGFLDD